MTTAKTEPTYHQLVVIADPNTVIWLVDVDWHLVQRATGTLDTSVQQGRYFIELGEAGPDGVAYPIELFGDLRVSQESLQASPACLRQSPKLLDE